MEMEQLSFPEAIEYLAKRAGIALENSHQDDAEAQAKRGLEELYQKVNKTFHYFLVENPAGKRALDYIAKRGFSMDIIERYQVGYAPSDPYWLFNFLSKKGYSPQFLEKSGLFSKKNARWGIFSGRLIFPIYEANGKIVAFGGRILEGEGPKYINSPETILYKKSSVLFGYFQGKNAIRDDKKVVVCEGYFDVLALAQAGINYAVAPLGTAFTEEQAKLLKRFGPQVNILFDEDAAGVNATMKALQLLEGLEIETRVVNLPEGKDPAEMLEKGGSQGLTNAVYSSSHALNYVLKKAVTLHDPNSPTGKEKVVEQLFAYVKAIVSSIKRDGAIEVIADSLGLDQRSLREDFDRYSVSNPIRVRSTSPYGNRTFPESRRAIRPELFLMIGACIHYEEFPRIRMVFSPGDFVDPWARELFIALEELFREGEIRFERILAKITDPGLQDLLGEKINSQEYLLNPKEIIDHSIQKVKADINLRKRTGIEAKIRALSLQNSLEANQEIEELIKEKMFLDQEYLILREVIHDRSAE